MKIAPVADVKARLSAYLDAAEEQGMAHSPRFRALLTKSRASLRTGRGIQADHFWTEVARTGQSKDHGRER